MPQVNGTILLPPQYLGKAAYYRVMATAPLAVIDTATRHDKRFKSVHRTTILSPGGKPVTLTVPVTHTPGARIWEDIRVSPHGHWWTVHAGAIESAYGRTPYFEYYYPLLRPLLDSSAAGMPITLFTSMIDAALRGMLGIDTPVSATLPPGLDAAAVTDMRGCRFGAGDEPSVLHHIFTYGPQALNTIMNEHGQADSGH